MSGLYLYCLTPAESSPGLELAGLAANPVSGLAVAGLTVWAEAAASAPRTSTEAIRKHDEIVRAVWMRAAACLPMRFGQWLPDLAALEQRLGGQQAEFERALARVKGAGEHGVRISETRAAANLPAQDEAPTTGRGYLEQLRARARAQEEHERRGNEVAVELASELEGIIRAQRVDPLPSDRGLVSVSHLVPRTREGEYDAALHLFRERHPELEMLRTGPWPPYSFGP